jgi:hypothetical protein
MKKINVYTKPFVHLIYYYLQFIITCNFLRGNLQAMVESNGLNQMN